MYPNQGYNFAIYLLYLWLLKNYLGRLYESEFHVTFFVQVAECPCLESEPFKAHFTNKSFKPTTEQEKSVQ